MCAANLELSVTSYSDGCKSKVQLCAGQLMNCDVLMFDEPNGYLEVDNIKWLEDWLESFTGRKLKTFEVTSVDFQYSTRTGPRLWK